MRTSQADIEAYSYERGAATKPVAEIAANLCLGLAMLSVLAIISFMVLALLGGFTASSFLKALLEAIAVVIGFGWMAAFTIGAVCGIIGFAKASSSPSPRKVLMKTTVGIFISTLQTGIFCWFLYGFAASI